MSTEGCPSARQASGRLRQQAQQCKSRLSCSNVKQGMVSLLFSARAPRMGRVKSKQSSNARQHNPTSTSGWSIPCSPLWLMALWSGVAAAGTLSPSSSEPAAAFAKMWSRMPC